jgi:hypothetical protein
LDDSCLSNSRHDAADVDPEESREAKEFTGSTTSTTTSIKNDVNTFRGEKATEDSTIIESQSILIVCKKASYHRYSQTEVNNF